MKKKWYVVGGVSLLVFVLAGLIYLFQASNSDQATATKSDTADGETNKAEDEKATEDMKANMASFKNVKGDVQLLRGDEVIPIHDEKLMSLQLDDRLKTSGNSSVSIYFHDETSMHLGEESEIVIKKWEQKTDQVAIEVEHVLGQVWHDVRTGDRYHVIQDSNILKVKGTLFLVTFDPNTQRTVLSVLDGIVGAERSASAPNSQPHVYPDARPYIQFTWDRDDEGPTADLVDIADLVQSVTADVLSRIIESILNQRDQYEELIDEENGQNDAFSSSLHAFIGNMLQEMERQNRIEPNELQDLLNEINARNSNLHLNLDNLPEFNPDRGDLDRIQKELEQQMQERNENHRSRLEDRVRQQQEMERQIQRQELQRQTLERMRQEQDQQRQQRERERERPDPSLPSPPKRESMTTFKVTDGKGPIEQASVTIGELKGETDADGKVTFNLRDGTYEYVVIADDHEIENGILEVRGPTEHHVTLNPLLGTVKGQVIEICQYSECNPPRSDFVSKAYIYVFAGKEIVAEAQTDEDGYYELNDLPVNEELFIKTRFPSDRVSDEELVELTSDRFQLLPGEIKVINLVHEAGYKLHVTVTDGHQRIENATIELRGVDKDDDIEGIEKHTDKNGEITFYVSEGEYIYTIHAEGYSSEEGYFTVEQEDIEMEMHLEPMPGTIIGQVVATCIDCLDGEDEVDGRGTNEQGYFEIDNLPPYTDFLVMARSGGERFSFELISEVVQVKPGETIEVNFEYVWQPEVPELEVGESGTDTIELFWDVHGERYEHLILLSESGAIDKTNTTKGRLMDLEPRTEYLIQIEAWWQRANSLDAIGEVRALT